MVISPAEMHHDVKLGPIRCICPLAVCVCVFAWLTRCAFACLQDMAAAVLAEG